MTFRRQILAHLARAAGSMLRRDPPDNDADRPSLSQSPTSRWEQKRIVVAGLATVLLVIALTGYLTGAIAMVAGSESAGRFAVSALSRIGLLLGAIALAWDSLKRPARWLPPGLAALGLVGVVVVAAQPRLMIALLPLAGIVFLLGTFLKAFRGP